MAKRNIDPRKGLWTLPAGFMENAETLQDGALRETFEETGSKAEIIMPYTMFSLPHINQIHMFYLANLLDDNFGPTVDAEAKYSDKTDASHTGGNHYEEQIKVTVEFPISKF